MKGFPVRNVLSLKGYWHARQLVDEEGRERKSERSQVRFGGSRTEHLYKGKKKILDLTCSTIEL